MNLFTIQVEETAKTEVKDFGSNRKLEMDGKRWWDGGYAYGFDYHYARNLEAAQKQIRFGLFTFTIFLVISYIAVL